MSQSGCARPKFHDGQAVRIKPPQDRPFRYLGDNDPDSAVHKELIVVGVETPKVDGHDLFHYSVAIDRASREVMITPESGLLAI
jgi:hypothetical protein